MSLTNSEYYVLHPFGKLDEERIVQLLAAEEDLQILLSLRDAVENVYLDVKGGTVNRATKVLMETINNKFKQIEGEF